MQHHRIFAQRCCINQSNLALQGGGVCTNYESATLDDLSTFTEFPRPTFDYPRSVYKDYAAPIFRMGEGTRSTDRATFGLVPRKHIPPGVKVFDTMNARAETVGEKRSFSTCWRNGQLCLIPASSFYEPNYETGKAVRWRIKLASGEPFSIAGLWRAWNDSLSFTMLTLNADSHPLLRRFHEPGSEKRGIVILRREYYDDWLTCREPEVARTFLSLLPADELVAGPAPLPTRKNVGDAK
ncbi:ATP synthase protein I [Mycetohabitans rhizoxinica HKI 454]|uniref:Abasic site processing protein n=2 Tax=Mycetohabitans rhizoxinica TaxID=412963 RepID=E5AS11_MYCRK|nr:ATP synthase protein I [Mycetohabitans rhizoxinica HKI 454]